MLTRAQRPGHEYLGSKTNVLVGTFKFGPVNGALIVNTG